MRLFRVYEDMYIDASGHKHRRRYIGAVTARNLLSAVRKARKDFRQASGQLIVTGFNPKTKEYEEAQI